jgi:predicted DNA-binding transcriptional regulator AlpA
MSIENKPATEPRPVLRRQQLPNYTGLQRSRINELIRLNQFPKPFYVGERTTVWYADEVAEWQRQRQRATERKATKAAP